MFVIFRRWEKLSWTNSGYLRITKFCLSVFLLIHWIACAWFVIAFIDNLKKKARQNYKAKMSYVFCTECGMLLGTTWSHYSSKAKFHFVCQRPLEGDKICGKKVVVTVEELLDKGGTNRPEITPEAMK